MSLFCVDVYPNAEPNNLPCGSFACTSKEGCHIPLQYCQIQPGHYLVVVTAVTVNDPFFPVYFTVLARMRQVGTTAKNAGDKWTGHLMLSEYEHYVVSNPGGHNWLDIELYVDSDSTDIPGNFLFLLFFFFV